MLDRTSCPDNLLLSATDIYLSKLIPERAYLDNKTPVYSFHSQTTELVKIDFFFEAGTVFQQKFFLAATANSLLSEGTKNKTAKEIADYLDYRGAYIEKNLDKDIASVSIYMLRKYAQDLIPLLAEIIHEPAYHEHELDIYIQKRKQQFLTDSMKVNFVARNQFAEMVFGKEHPYGRRGEFIDYDLLNVTDLHDFHTSYYLNSHVDILASGMIDDEVLTLLNKHFGYQKNGQKPIGTGFPSPQITQKEAHIDMPNTVQSAVRIGKSCIHIHHPDIYKLMILNTVLGGYFGSRLMKNIREEKGYTYGIYSGVYSFREASMFLVSAEVASDASTNAIHEVRNELKRLRTEPIPTEELELVRNYLVGDFIRTMDGVFELSEKYKSTILFPNTENYYQNYIQVLANVTAEELQETAEKHLHEDSMCELSVGNLPK